MAGPRQLYYDKENNIMIDEWGEPVFNIFEIITPNTLHLFKQHKDYMVARTLSGELVELMYPEQYWDY